MPKFFKSYFYSQHRLSMQKQVDYQKLTIFDPIVCTNCSPSG